MTRILVVEVSPGSRLVWRRILTLEGYGVEVAATAKPPCAARVRDDPPDPAGRDAASEGRIQVCRELRRGGLQTPIILLTARAQEAEKVLGLQLGAGRHVTKRSARWSCERASRRCCAARAGVPAAEI